MAQTHRSLENLSRYFDGLKRGGMLAHEASLDLKYASKAGLSDVTTLRPASKRLRDVLWNNAHLVGVDLALLKRFYDAVIELQTREVKSAIVASSNKLLPDLLVAIEDPFGVRQLDSVTVIRTIIALLENMLFTSPDYHAVFSKLWTCILSLPENWKSQLNVGS
ncbi:hypothetical protein R1sor_012776 [Riccia sorocarpa]|uniref:Uncharacterized protein n=1 Tax=Riccia sorocarpa TaxID=122646 RepID=A0ABD3I4Q4_9MARC